jgi:hypothetical protein
MASAAARTLFRFMSVPILGAAGVWGVPMAAKILLQQVLLLDCYCKAMCSITTCGAKYAAVWAAVSSVSSRAASY